MLATSLLSAMNLHPDGQEKDTVFGDLNQLQSLTSTMDERSLVLALGGFAEDALGDLIRAFMLPGEQANRLLNGFNAPIGTFSARIKTAFALGLITEGQHNDLDRLRKVRNIFAHGWKPTSLSDQNIASHVSAMNFSTLDEDFPETPIDKVRTSIGALLVELRSATHQIAKNRLGAKLIGTHLLVGLTGPLENQVKECEARLAEIMIEMREASGDRARFLQASYVRWTGNFEIVRRNAPAEGREEIRAALADIESQWSRLKKTT